MSVINCDLPIFDTPANFVLEARSIFSKQYSAPKNRDPHLSLEWFVLLAETAIPAGTKLTLYPLDIESGGSFIPLMVLENAKRKLLGLSTFYTPLFGLVREAQADKQVLVSLARSLRQLSPKFSEAQFSPMDSDSESFTLLRNGFKEAGWLVDDFYCFGNWYQPVEPGCFEKYLADRPSRLRNTLLRAERKLSKTPEYRLHIFQKPDEHLKSAINAFTQVYNRSWKQPEPYPEFIPELCLLAARSGWLRLGLIFIKNEPVAAQLWLVVDTKAYIVKLAYDQSFIKTSAGTVLSAALFKYVIDVDHVEEVDYLIGDDTYKQDWMTQRRERRGVVAFNPKTPRGAMKAAHHFVGKWLRQFR